MTELVELHSHPQLSNPTLIVALEGWIDAGNAAAAAMTSILDNTDTELVATFDSDELLDQRARRPIMSIVDGHMNELTWPATELRAGIDESGNHVLLLIGAEPDHRWGAFCQEVVSLALDLEVQQIIGLDAYPAPVPHTRTTMLSLTSPSSSIVEAHHGFVSGTVEVPAGVQAAIEMHAHDAGISALALWAQVPHYISAMTYSAGSLALIEGLARVGGLTFPTAELAIEAVSTRERLDELVAGNPQHEAMLRQLEEAADSMPLTNQLGPLPSGDEIADEFERFLREQG